MNVIARFPLVDQYMGLRMDVDFSEVKPDRVTVVESSRRLRRKEGYGFIRALWWVWLEDGRSVASVPPGTARAFEGMFDSGYSGHGLLDPNIVERLKKTVNAAIVEAGLRPIDRDLSDVVLACNGSLLLRHKHGEVRRLVDDSIPPATGLRLPMRCFPDGIVYAAVVDAEAVSIAFAHRNGVMQDRVVDLGVETAPAHRRRGYAKTAVSAVVAHIAESGGEARYGCSPDNKASIATARSVGFVPYGTSFVLSTSAVDVEA